MNLNKIKKVYVVGIKGSGMVALAELFFALGKEVIGSDVDQKFFTDKILKKLGIKFYEGFSIDNIKNEKGVDLVVYSIAYSKENNEEMKFVIDNQIPHLSNPEFLGEFMKTKFGIAVSGTHGKTTTSAMLALAMRNSGADPTAIIGSTVTEIDSSLMVGESEYFVLEADEYRNKLALYDPMVAIITSVAFDHPDCFSNFEEYKNVFKKFVRRIPRHGFLVAWGEDNSVLEVAKEANCKIVIYGKFSDATKIGEIKKYFAEVGKENLEFLRVPSNLELSVPGEHNRLNATAVLAVAKELKLDEKKILESLKDFQGTKRRFEILGKRNGGIVVDDYAHHPDEVQATLKAAREKYPNKKIVCVFHPHTFTRTKALLDEFSKSFKIADEVIILDIYGSAREVAGDVHSKDLVEKIKTSNIRVSEKIHYIPTLDKVFEYLKDKVDSSQVVITMGAGDVCDLGKRLVG